MNHWIKMSLLNKRWNIEYKMTIAEQNYESLNKIWVYWTKKWHIEYKMTITEQKYESLNINCMLLNIATIRQPYQHRAPLHNFLRLWVFILCNLFIGCSTAIRFFGSSVLFIRGKGRTIIQRYLYFRCFLVILHKTHIMLLSSRLWAWLQGTNAMVTYCVTKMLTACPPMIGQFFWYHDCSIKW